MKDYQEMAEALFQRRNRYLAERKKKMNTLIKTISAVSCFCLAVLSGFWFLNSSPEADLYTNINPVHLEDLTEKNLPDKSNTVTRESLPESSNGIADMSTSIPSNPLEGIGAIEKYTENKQDSDATPTPENAENERASDNASVPENTENEQDSDASSAPENGANNSSDVSISEQSPGSLQAVTVKNSYADFFGGSYTNEQGRLCILLTEDTPENRALICRELGVQEDTVVFQNASYTLSYLQELQVLVSNGMISKELDFVIVSSLREDTNRLHLTVTTEDETLLEKLKALDSLGGALEIEYAPDSGIRNQIQKK